MLQPRLLCTAVSSKLVRLAKMHHSTLLLSPLHSPYPRCPRKWQRLKGTLPSKQPRPYFHLSNHEHHSTSPSPKAKTSNVLTHQDPTAPNLNDPLVAAANLNDKVAANIHDPSVAGGLDSWAKLLAGTKKIGAIIRGSVSGGWSGIWRFQRGNEEECRWDSLSKEGARELGVGWSGEG